VEEERNFFRVDAPAMRLIFRLKRRGAASRIRLDFYAPRQGPADSSSRRAAWGNRRCVEPLIAGCADHLAKGQSNKRQGVRLFLPGVVSQSFPASSPLLTRTCWVDTDARAAMATRGRTARAELLMRGGS